MSKLKIRDEIYSVTEYKDELKPSKDGRPWISEFYKLLNEEEEVRYMVIWSDDQFEIADQPMSAKPEIEGKLSEIEKVEEPNISSKFNFMVKFKGDKKWQDISEAMASHLLRVYYPDEEISDKIQDIKFGHKYNVRGIQIESWPNEREAGEEDVKLLLNNECINCQIGARCWLISDSDILPQHIKNGLFEDSKCKIKKAIEKSCITS